MASEDQEQLWEDLELLLEELTTEQIRFVVARQECATDKEGAKAIGVSAGTVKNWKYAGTPIDEAIRLMALDGVVVALHLRRKALAKAMLVKHGGLDSKDERIQQGTATEIIEWELGKATQRQKMDMMIRKLDLSKLTDEQLERLAAGEELIHVLADQGTG